MNDDMNDNMNDDVNDKITITGRIQKNKKSSSNQIQIISYVYSHQNENQSDA